MGLSPETKQVCQNEALNNPNKAEKSKPIVTASDRVQEHKGSRNAPPNESIQEALRGFYNSRLTRKTRTRIENKVDPKHPIVVDKRISPELFEAVEKAKKSGLDVAIVTEGKAFEIQILDKNGKPLDTVSVGSFDASSDPSSWQKPLIEKIGKLTSYDFIKKNTINEINKLFDKEAKKYYSHELNKDESTEAGKAFSEIDLGDLLKKAAEGTLPNPLSGSKTSKDPSRGPEWFSTDARVGFEGKLEANKEPLDVRGFEKSDLKLPEAPRK